MDIKREILEVDVLIVGAGPAGLSAALHLSNLTEKEGNKPNILIIEKAKEIGDHSISGAVMDPRSINELIADPEKQKEIPIESVVNDDKFVYLTSKGKFISPMVPPQLSNKGKYIVSVNKLVRWLGEKVAEKGIDILTGIAGVEPLFDGNKLIGVRTGDKGINKKGEQKPNFEPGVDIHAGVTIFAEGSRGSLTKIIVDKLKLQNINPQIYATGVKEIWQIKNKSVETGKVIHTLGYPLRLNEYGGGFIYFMKDNLVSIGLVVALDYKDPLLDVHYLFQKYKSHPFISSILENGEIVNYGAKTIPEGGLYSIPKPYFDGGIIIGDAAGFLNSQKLKGIHLAIKTGMIAAEVFYKAFKQNDYSERTLLEFRKLVDDSFVKQELYLVRNFRQGFKKGLFAGMFNTSIQQITGGRGLNDKARLEEDYKNTETLKEFYKTDKVDTAPKKFTGKLASDKVTSAYYSGTKHEEDQPAHLKISDYEICNKKCGVEYGNPCQFFCPATVYEMVEGDGVNGKVLKLNPSNCVHCKTCDINDPYGIITWVPPEGGGGPIYKNM